MVIRNGSAPRRFRLAARQPRWQLILAFTPVVLTSLVVLGVASYRTASELLRQQASQQLHALRINVAREIEGHFSRVESHVVSLARDPSTLLALRQLGDATVELDTAPITEPAKMRPRMASLKRFLENYYQGELKDKALDLRALLLPQRSAVWLQATYLTSGTDPAGSDPKEATPYARSHATWDPVFRSELDRSGFDDVYLVDAASGRLVYSARKRPDFQTSLIDGPYAASAIGVLFRALQTGPNDGHYRIVDFAPYPPAHGKPTAFAGAPIIDHGRVVGALVVQLASEPLTRILSAEGQWPQSGLGETGELYLVGRGDGDLLMRSESRFGPLADARPATGDGSRTAVLSQRVTSQATAAANNGDEYDGAYVSYRSVPVLGSAGRLSHLNGLDWTLIAEMSSAEALRPLSRLRSRTAWFTGLLLVGAFLLTIGLSAVFASPPPATTIGTSDRQADDYRRRLEADLRPVLTAVVAASEGDLSQRITLNGSPLGNLPHALNRMWRSAGALVSHVHSTTAAAVESARQIQTAVGQLSQDAVQHTTELATTNTLLREMQSRLDALAAEATMASHAGQFTDAVARQSAEAVTRVAEGMEALQKHARTLTMRMKRLGERSMEISTVTATMQEITAQANMLALNATIEASRAGEPGLGFKTVANDIRKLAARTEAAAKDIADLVTTLHSEAADAVDCIDTQSEDIERQTSVIADAGHMLSRYRDIATQQHGPLAGNPVATWDPARATAGLSDAIHRTAEFVRRTHVLSEQAVHSSAALLSILSELNSWAQTFRLRTGPGTSAQPTTRAEVIELETHEAVGNGRGAGA